MDRFDAEVVNATPKTLRLSGDVGFSAELLARAKEFDGTTPDPTLRRHIEFEFDGRAESEVSRTVLEVETERGAVELKVIIIGNQVYARFKQLSEAGGSPNARWITGERNSLEARSVLEVAVSTGVQFDAQRVLTELRSELTGPWTATAVESCRENQTCFVLQRQTDISQQVFVDTKTYRPVLFRNPGSLGWASWTIEFDAVLIDWDADLNISPPEDAEKLPSGEFNTAVAYMLAFSGEGMFLQPAARTPAAS